MTRVLEETTEQDIDRDHIERRIDDWANRIDALYHEIEGWLPLGWSAARPGTVRMHEEPMQRFGVAARELPVLELSFNGTPSARIEPRGLWIVGLNGRLDLFRGREHYIIFDIADNFDPADWRIAPFSDRRKQQRFDRQTFVSVL